jgi:Uma2 family endonuclease
MQPSRPTDQETRPQAEALGEYRWSRAQFEQMIEAGVLGPDDRVELIHGSLVPMSPQGSAHYAAIELISTALRRVVQAGCHVRPQGPLALGDDSEPEPDVAIVEGRVRDFVDAHPTSALLVVEVAVSSLEKDRTLKQSLYAQHGVSEYWIVDLDAGRLEVYRDPSSDTYQTKQTFTDEAAIQPAGTDGPVSVADLLP